MLGRRRFSTRWVVALMVSSLSLAALMSVSENRGPHSIEYELPLPHRVSISWEDEVKRFAGRLQSTFEYLNAERALRYSGMILEASHRQHVDPEWIAALVNVESHFRDNVRSSVGAIGPAQVRPEIWTKPCGGVDLGIPEHNIQCGAQILALFYEYDGCNDFACALSMYNVGPGNMRRSAKLKAVGKNYATKVGQSRQSFVAP